MGDTLGIDLELEAEEKHVGPFRADILCKDTGSNAWVLIENQLERTDHSHLGQLITYAAGLKAVTIVWIASTFTDEHRAAIDWLNSISDDDFRFFALEIELWKIGDSPAAPKFNVIAKPNDWWRSVSAGKKRIEGVELTPTKQSHLAFWAGFAAHLKSQNSPIRPTKPYPQHWMNFSIGRTGFKLGAILSTPDERIGVELYIDHDDAKQYFRALLEDRAIIEEETGVSAEWNELSHRKASKIIAYLEHIDPHDETRWPDYFEWLRSHLEHFDRAFRKRIKQL